MKIENVSYSELSRNLNSFLIKSLGMDYSIINLRVENSLSKFSNVRNLTTIISKNIYDQMINEDMDGKIFTGLKYHYPKSDTLFDILLDFRDFTELNKIDSKESPIVPYFESSKIIKPQKYFLSINKLSPNINKFFLGMKGKNPHLFNLIGSSFNENSSKKKMFIPSSYILLNKKY